MLSRGRNKWTRYGIVVSSDEGGPDIRYTMSFSNYFNAVIKSGFVVHLTRWWIMCCCHKCQ